MTITSKQQNANRTITDTCKKSDGGDDLLEKVESSSFSESVQGVTKVRGRRFYPDKYIRYWRKKRRKEGKAGPAHSSIGYRYLLVKEMKEYMERHPAETALGKAYWKRIEKRMERIEGCGRHVEVLRCSGCKTEQLGTGKVSPQTMCHSRFCPICSEIRSSAHGRRMTKVFDRVQVVEGHEWIFLTLTTRRSSKVVELMPGVSGFKDAAERLLKVMKELWEKLLKKPGAGLTVVIEPSYSGMVHVHGVYYGPRIDKVAFDEEARKVDGFAGYSSIESLERYRRDETRKAVQKAARYAAKGGKRRMNKWATAYYADCLNVSKEMFEENDRWHGIHSDIVPPGLAARWEIATMNVKLTRNYGAFILRGENPENAEEERDENIPERCQCCDLPAEFMETVIKRTDVWHQKCHDLNEPAMRATVRARESKRDKKKRRLPSFIF